MDYEEQLAKAILELAHERVCAGDGHPCPFTLPIDNRLEDFWVSNDDPLPDGCCQRTVYRRRLLDILGIPITYHWLRRQ